MLAEPKTNWKNLWMPVMFNIETKQKIFLALFFKYKKSMSFSTLHYLSNIDFFGKISSNASVITPLTKPKSLVFFSFKLTNEY